MISTKRHPIRFYLTVVFAFFLFTALGSFMIYLYFDASKKGQAEPKTMFMLPFGIAVLFMAFYTLRQYIKNSPKITVDENHISFGQERFLLTDIKSITLTGKIPFRYLIRFPFEGAVLEFENGTVKYIYSDMYSNAWRIKSFLEKTVIEKGSYHEHEIIRVKPDVIRFQHVDYFKGIQLTSLRGIVLWGLIAMMLVPVISKQKIPSSGFWVFFGVFASFWFLLNSWFMHYFGLTNEYLVAKNHNLVWIQHVYRLHDIKEIVFESQGNMPNCLRVITKDYRNKLYPAATIRDKTWLELKDRLEGKGVIVRNECIY